jgi:hypothetical protein
MKSGLFSRTWISPTIFIAFLVVAITGVFLAFHLTIGGMKEVHQWIGCAFVVIGAIHIALNWKAFAVRFRERSAILATCAGIMLSSAIFCLGSVGEKHHKPDPFIQALDANKNGVIDADDMSRAGVTLKKLDADNDGVLTADEIWVKASHRGKAHASE